MSLRVCESVWLRTVANCWYCRYLKYSMQIVKVLDLIHIVRKRYFTKISLSNWMVWLNIQLYMVYSLFRVTQVKRLKSSFWQPTLYQIKYTGWRYSLFIDFIADTFWKQCRIRALISTPQLVELLGEIWKKEMWHMYD